MIVPMNARFQCRMTVTAWGSCDALVIAVERWDDEQNAFMTVREIRFRVENVEDIARGMLAAINKE